MAEASTEPDQSPKAMKLPRPTEDPTAPADGVKRKHRRMYHASAAGVPGQVAHSRRTLDRALTSLAGLVGASKS